MQFHQLKRVHPNKRSVPVGRGGKRGKTSGRGGKGQTARAGHKIYPQLRDVLRRIPKLRGRGKSGLKSFKEAAAPVNLDILEKHFENGEIVSPSTLMERELLLKNSGKVPSVKILGRGVLSKKLTVKECLISKSAKVAIEKAGGIVEIENVKVKNQNYKAKSQHL